MDLQLDFRPTLHEVVEGVHPEHEAPPFIYARVFVLDPTVERHVEAELTALGRDLQAYLASDEFLLPVLESFRAAFRKGPTP
jgi:hypothetical protein